jgi:hypothetical protein
MPGINDYFATDLDLTGTPAVALPNLVELVDLKPVGTVELAELLALVLGEEPDEVLDAPALQDHLVREESADGPWVLRLADDAVDALAALDDARAAEVAERWRHAETWKFEDRSPPVDDVREWLDDLRALCRDARTRGCAVYRLIAV